jgi:hypothetical protein
LYVFQCIAYVFDFGDEWRVRLKLVDVRDAGDAPGTALLDSRGAAPPQYAWDEVDLSDVA